MEGRFDPAGAAADTACRGDDILLDCCISWQQHGAWLYQLGCASDSHITVLKILSLYTESFQRVCLISSLWFQPHPGHVTVKQRFICDGDSDGVSELLGRTACLKFKH